MPSRYCLVCYKALLESNDITFVAGWQVSGVDRTRQEQRRAGVRPQLKLTDKPRSSAALTEIESADPELVGMLEVHTCPGCGNIEVRQAT